MRVIAGTLKGRRLKAPAWEGLRPTSDKLRETLFNVIAPRVGGARVLDGYAGTGAVGIEAISRGAAHVTFVERDPRALALVAENLAHCSVQSGYAIIRATVARSAKVLRSGPAFVPFNLILLDPPYDQPPALVLAAVDGLLAPDGLIVLEHARRQASPEAVDRLVRGRVLLSGESALSFYTCQP
jgi:16S rRNA (guanine966-N2)-methyltransferase